MRIEYIIGYETMMYKTGVTILGKKSILISQNLELLAKMIDEMLEGIAGERQGFSLVVFAQDDSERTGYISNCERKQAAIALRNLLKKWEDPYFQDIPEHKLN